MRIFNHLSCSSVLVSILGIYYSSRAQASRISPRDVVFQALENLAVTSVAKGVTRVELMKMWYGNDELVRIFTFGFQGKAQTCGFGVKVVCPCGSNKTSRVNYTQELIKDVLIAGHVTFM